MTRVISKNSRAITSSPVITLTMSPRYDYVLHELAGCASTPGLRLIVHPTPAAEV